MPRARFGVTLSVALLLYAGLGCAYLRRARTPMPSVAFSALGPARARGAFVLLPGFGDRTSAFAEHGFVAALRRQAPNYDVIAADAHFGYYRSRALLARLEQDVIGPLRSAGYRELWLVGTSMGGHGAIAYARAHRERIAGLLLFAPYMGPQAVVEEVERAGGLCAYQPPPSAQDATGFARANFAFLRTIVCTPSPHGSAGAQDIAVWLAVGANDRLLAADRSLGQALPPDRFLTPPGGHGWAVWTPALERVLPLVFAPGDVPR